MGGEEELSVRSAGRAAAQPAMETLFCPQTLQEGGQN